jgi:hypothetical protein
MVTTLSGAASTSRLLPAFTSRRGRVITVVSAVALTIAGFAIVVALRGRGDDAPKVVSYSTIAHPAGASPSSVETPAGSSIPPPVEPPAQPTAPPAPAITEPPQPSAPPAPARVEPATQPDRPAPARVEPAAQADRPGPTHAEPDRPAPAHVEPTKKPAEPAPHPPVVAPHVPAPLQERVDVTFDSNPSGAQVVIAGKALGKTPFHGALPRRNGDVTVLVRLAGYVDRTVVVRAGQVFPDVIKLVKVAQPRPPRGNRDQSVNPFGD